MAAPETEKKERRTKLVMVKQGYIDCLLKQREEHPHRQPFPTCSPERFAELYRDQPDRREIVVGIWARAAALLKKMRDEDDGIVEQYRTKGYAMQGIEVRDGEV